MSTPSTATYRWSPACAVTLEVTVYGQKEAWSRALQAMRHAWCCLARAATDGRHGFSLDRSVQLRRPCDWHDIPSCQMRIRAAACSGTGDGYAQPDTSALISIKVLTRVGPPCGQTVGFLYTYVG